LGWVHLQQPVLIAAVDAHTGDRWCSTATAESIW
jgi:hypothetical protein